MLKENRAEIIVALSEFCFTECSESSFVRYSSSVVCIDRTLINHYLQYFSLPRINIALLVDSSPSSRFAT